MGNDPVERTVFLRMTNSLRRYFILPLAIVLLVPAMAQPTWQRSYGGLGSEQGHGVCATTDGGAIVVGSTGSFGNGGGDIYVMALDIDGTRLWSHSYGGASVDQGWAVRSLGDGGAIVAGFTNTGQGNGYDGLLLRLDPQGEVIWQRTIGTSSWDLLYDVEALPDGFIAVGQSFGVGDGSGDIWSVRTDAQGDTLWTRHYGTASQDEARGVRSTNDGGFLVAGTLAVDSDTSDAVVLKYDAEGTLAWSAPVAGNGLDVGSSVAEAQDGSILLGGWSNSFSDAQNVMISRLDASGSVQWTRVIGGAAGMQWFGREIRELPDGRIVVGAQTNEFGLGGMDFYLLFASSDGYYLAGPSFGGTDDDVCWSMDIASDGFYYLVGSTGSFGPGSSAVFVVRSDGNVAAGPVIVDLDPLVIEGTTGRSSAFILPNIVSRPQEFTIEPMDAGDDDRVTIIDMTGRPVVSGLRLTGSRRLSSAGFAVGSYAVLQRASNGAVRTGRLLVR